ncbi:MAG: DUF1343 domain-containing protein [Balneolia bacterium]|nr:DUF1343 domain-containing protein [Balneolia bacterium]
MNSPSLKTGAQLLTERYLHELEGRNIGLIANPTARVGNSHLLDLLTENGVRISSLFAPEHGFRGDQPAGEEIRGGVDVETGLTVHSLYGSTRKPTPEMLQDVDLLIFDMQDVGVRFYTYISTLGLVLEAAAEQDVEVWVLDRPNPLGGEYVSGWMMQDEHTSFVGAFPIPVVHGLTMGEIAIMINEEGWTGAEKKAYLRVIEMENWSRSQHWTETGLDWRAPSPNLPHFTNTLVYPGTCFFEGSTMSEGRGTTDPFMLVGSPGQQFTDEQLEIITNRYPVSLQRVEFVPDDIPGMAVNPKHKGETVIGVRVSPLTVDPMRLRPLEMGLELFRLMLHSDPDAETNRFLYNLAGTTQIDHFLEHDNPAAVYWQEELDLFRELRENYLLYE